MIHYTIIFKPQHEVLHFENGIHYRFVILILLLIITTSQAHHLVDLFYRLISRFRYIFNPQYILLFELFKHEEVISEVFLLSHVHLDKGSFNQGDLLVETCFLMLYLRVDIYKTLNPLPV